MYYVSRFLGFLTPLPPPLSSIVSIWHDPPLVLRRKGKKLHIYVLLKGPKQIVQSLYLPEKNKNSFQFLLLVEIGDFLSKL